MVSVGVSVLLWVQVARPSGADITTKLMEALEVTGVSLTSTNHERQSVALLHAPDNQSKVMLYAASSSDHLLTLMFAFLPFRNFCRGLWSLGTTVMVVPLCYDRVNIIGYLFCSGPFPFGVCEHVGEKCNWQFLAIMFL